MHKDYLDFCNQFQCLFQELWYKESYISNNRATVLVMIDERFKKVDIRKEQEKMTAIIVKDKVNNLKVVIGCDFTLQKNIAQDRYKSKSFRTY